MRKFTAKEIVAHVIAVLGERITSTPCANQLPDEVWASSMEEAMAVAIVRLSLGHVESEPLSYDRMFDFTTGGDL